MKLWPIVKWNLVWAVYFFSVGLLGILSHKATFEDIITLCVGYAIGSLLLSWLVMNGSE